MAQGEFTKQEANRVIVLAGELYDALSKSKRFSFIGHLNDICLFLERARDKAPDEKDQEKKQ